MISVETRRERQRKLVIASRKFGIRRRMLSGKLALCLPTGGIGNYSQHRRWEMVGDAEWGDLVG